MKGKTRKKLSAWKILCLSYLTVIVVGALLLCLPVATRAGEEKTTFVKALFTTTSATCVTGNIAFDTNTHWTIFGQTVIILLIQLGGLGVMTFVSILFKMLGKKMSLSNTKLLMMDKGESNHSEIRGLFRRVLFGTLLFEGIGAVLLSIRFVQDFGWGKGVYYGVWHSISAFCNAGFDLLGGLFNPDGSLVANASSFNCALGGEKFVSLTHYATDPLVTLTVCGLIIIGGLGFCVWGDVIDKKFNPKKFALHTKIVLSMTAVLLVGGTCLFMLFERNNPEYAMKGYNFGDKLLACFFSATTPRTAGFNSSDMLAFSNSSILLTVILMFVGAAPASTAGGIKVTTTFVIIMGIVSVFRGNRDIEVGKRRVHNSLLRQALAVFVSCLAIVTVANLAILAIEEPRMAVHIQANGEGYSLLRATLIDTFSAMGTVGLSLNFSPNLHPASMMILAVLMYIGRVGVVTLGMAFAEKSSKTTVRKPAGDILIG